MGHTAAPNLVAKDECLLEEINTFPLPSWWDTIPGFVGVSDHRTLAKAR